MRRLFELLRDLREAPISHDDAWRMLATKHTAGAQMSSSDTEKVQKAD